MLPNYDLYLNINVLYNLLIYYNLIYYYLRQIQLKNQYIIIIIM